MNLRVVLLLGMACSCSRRESLPLNLEPGSASGYDVVLVTIDTLRADRLGSYGHHRARTPTLDRLASEGLRFETAISPVPLTLPAHASIMTGLDPASHGVRHNGIFRLDESRTTLAEILESRGYATGAFVSSFVLDARYGLGQGFRSYDASLEPPSTPSLVGLESERSAKAVTDAGIAWLRDRPSGAPYFLWMHYYDPHAPYEPPEGFSGDYDGEIAYVDSEVARLVEALPDHDRLLLLIVGDHGESLGEHRERTHSRLLYEATQRVPWILWSPSLVTRPRVIEDMVGLVDLAPTLLDLLGLESFRTDGKSLLRIDASDRYLYLETLAPYFDNGWAPLYAMRSASAKYIAAPKPEMYDLASDPGETRNLFRSGGDAPPLASALEEKLGEAPGLEAVRSGIQKLDPGELRRLQSLGYLGGPGPAGSGELPDPKDMMPVLKLVEDAGADRRAGRLEDAIEKMERARKGAPRDLLVLETLGILTALAGRMEEAESILRERLSLAASPDVAIILANVLRETGRAPEGKAILEEAMAIETEHGGLLVTLGDFLAAEGRPAEALALYARAKDVDPSRASALANSRIREIRSRR
jgi:arylsulfatase A-like enzyme